MDQNNEFPEEAVKKLGKLGWMGIPYPKEYGGAGLDALSYAIAVEELARVDGGTGVNPLRSRLPRLMAHFRLWHRGAEEEISGSAGQGREDRRSAYRDQRRIRRRRHGDHGAG